MKGSIAYTICRTGLDATGMEGDVEIAVTIDYTITPIIRARISGQPEDCYPAEGGEVDIVKVTRNDTGEAVQLNADEEEAVATYIQDHHEFDDPRDEPDYND